MKELVVIDEITVEGSLLTRKFACDLLKCKGACCSIPGGRGAPLLDEEIAEIEEALPAVLPLLTEDKKEEIKRVGFYEGVAGNFATTCVDDRDCVFVSMEDGIAKCAIEKAYNQGKTDFRKPISCHLFPIRVRNFGGEVLRYHEIPECRPAVANGESRTVGVTEFLRDALVRKYGSGWYAKLDTYRKMNVVELDEPSGRI